MELAHAARAILQGRSLEEKLRVFDVEALTDGPVGHRIEPEPGREPHLAIRKGRDKLPPQHQLGSSAARAGCLHRFANHELQAIELFAWAALRFPDAPWAFRQGLMRTLVDEQRHLRAYLDRMKTYGLALGDLELTGNFWTQAPRLETAPAFVCAMGLTFENANLDFSLLYERAFAQHGAADDALVMHRVHLDEQGHVGWALSWLRRFKDPAQSDLAAYQAHVPFPLGLHRAKSRTFDAAARRAAGMDEGMIEATRLATSPQQDRPDRATSA